MNVRFIAQAMQAYFDRDAVALPGIANYFGASPGLHAAQRSCYPPLISILSGSFLLMYG